MRMALLPIHWPFIEMIAFSASCMGQNNVQHVLLKINKVHQINPVTILISLRKAACYVSDNLILVVLHVPRHTTNSSVYATEPSTLT